MKDKDVISVFVDHLSNHGHPGLKVERWPDDENRRSEEIDAIAGPFAIEHTSIDTVANQRRDDDWYLQVVGGLEDELTDHVDFHLSIILQYDAIQRGQDWAALRADLRGWVLEYASCLSYGSYELDLPINPSLPVRVIKCEEGPRGVYFPRFEPPHERTLPERIKRVLDRKGAKLEKYQGPGATTILLVENDDIALMNDGKMLDAMRKAYPNGLPPGTDQLWFADTSIPTNPHFRNFTAYVIGADC